MKSTRFCVLDFIDLDDTLQPENKAMNNRDNNSTKQSLKLGSMSFYTRCNS